MTDTTARARAPLAFLEAEIDELKAKGLYRRLRVVDENRDGLLSGAEMERGSVNDVYPPNVTFVDRHTVTLGGKRVVMVHLGNAHAPDSAVLHFPDERAVFSADILQAKRLPKDEPYTACLPMGVPRVNPYPWKFAMTSPPKQSLSGRGPSDTVETRLATERDLHLDRYYTLRGFACRPLDVAVPRSLWAGEPAEP